jgi:hypothetical protein
LRAEGQGFEPWMGYPMPVFKTGAIGHSAIPPVLADYCKELETCKGGQLPLDRSSGQEKDWILRPPGRAD